MSTNAMAYRSQQRIDFSVEQPALYYGWYVSGHAHGTAVCPFRAPEPQEAFVSLVERAMNDPAAARGTAEEVAAFLALSSWGDTEDDREWGKEIIASDYPDKAQVLYELENELCELWEPGLPELAAVKAVSLSGPEGGRSPTGEGIPAPQGLAQALGRVSAAVER